MAGFNKLRNQLRELGLGWQPYGSEVQSNVVHLNRLQCCGYADLFLDELKHLGDINQR